MPNAEIERLKLVEKVNILERNVADLEKQLYDAYNRICELQSELVDSQRQQQLQYGNNSKKLSKQN